MIFTKSSFYITSRSSLDALEPPTFRLTVERANRLRHRDWCFLVTAVIKMKLLYLKRAKNHCVYFGKRLSGMCGSLEVGLYILMIYIDDIY